MSQVYRYQCCNNVEFTTTVKKRICNSCKQPIETDIIEYDNVFNILKFIKGEWKGWNVSPTAVALFDDLIKTIVLIQSERCIKRAEIKGEKTIMAKNFDWKILDEFKEYLEWRYEE